MEMKSLFRSEAIIQASDNKKKEIHIVAPEGLIDLN
jgi:hypothetical protein